MTDILRLSLPITLWLVGFSALYAIQGLSCSRHWPMFLGPFPILLAACSVFVLLQSLALWLLIRNRSPSIFIQTTAIALAASAIFATGWTMLPVLFATSCH